MFSATVHNPHIGTAPSARRNRVVPKAMAFVAIGIGLSLVASSALAQFPPPPFPPPPGPLPPPFLYDAELPSPDTCLCLPYFMLQNPSLAHNWWARAEGGFLSITLVALSVNGAEGGAVQARLFDPSGAMVGYTLIPYPPVTGAEAAGPPMTVPFALPDGRYRIEVSLVAPWPEPPARHYTLKVHGASLLGAHTPLQVQSEANDARWHFNVAPGERFVYRLRSGPEAGATSARVDVYDASGALRSSLVNGVGSFIDLFGEPSGMWTVAIRGANGHYYMEKLDGMDRGAYISYDSFGYGTIAGTILSPLPVEVQLLDLAGNVLQSLAGVVGSFEFDKLPVAQYVVRVLPPPPIGIPPDQRVLVTCDLVARLLFEFPNGAPLADAGPDQVVPEVSLVILDGSASFDPDFDPLTYAWSLVTAIGPPIILGDPSAPMPAFFASDDASYEFELIVRDPLGAFGSDRVRVDVRNVVPEADAGPDVTQYWGLPALFVGAGSDVGPLDVAAGLASVYDFGDGGAAPGFVASHIYAAPGIYDVTLTVTDKDGGVGSDHAFAFIDRRPTSLTIFAPGPYVEGSPIHLTVQVSDDVDAGTAQLGGLTIEVEILGLSLVSVTDASGMAAFDVSLAAGSYLVNASFAGSLLYLPSHDQASLEVAPVPPADSDGKVTGGHLRFENKGRGGFNVQSTDGQVKGELEFHAGRFNYHAHDLFFLRVSEDCTVATFSGVSEEGVPFEAYVEDNGEPGRDDIFRITIGGVVMNGDGALTGGNIQIHCPHR